MDGAKYTFHLIAFVLIFVEAYAQFIGHDGSCGGRCFPGDHCVDGQCLCHSNRPGCQYPRPLPTLPPLPPVPPVPVCNPACAIVGGLCNFGICYCFKGWAGNDCSILIDLCEPACNPNPAAATCERGICVCRGGWTGPTCNTPGFCRPDPCVFGVCNADRRLCDCFPATQFGRWTGRYCDQIERCSPTNPCQNGAICSNNVAMNWCTCLPGFSGPYCENTANLCSPNPCQNGGRCFQNGQCSCPPGFQGTRCETPLRSQCTPFNPCQNGGACQEFGPTICSCPSGYSGTYCEIPRCNVVCLNGGECTIIGDISTCFCGTPYTGVNCELVHSCPENFCPGQTCRPFLNPICV